MQRKRGAMNLRQKEHAGMHSDREIYADKQMAYACDKNSDKNLPLKRITKSVPECTYPVFVSYNKNANAYGGNERSFNSPTMMGQPNFALQYI
ncbi:conserved hypothetical protein [Ricinus communis]|uniref:Uncharacterized protein n=1 Tax=Ricinus communis TaxID=3988 RepID=B9RGV2_RICCO|nr:conserved hypothetical protein [Ricinus communis]